MTENDKYDALGEFFRQRLENHRMPVDVNDWDKIERSLGKRNNKGVIWLWLGGAMTAAATIAAFLMIVKPATDNAAVMAVSQQIVYEVPLTVTPETAPTAIGQEIAGVAIIANDAVYEIMNESSANFSATSANLDVTQSQNDTLNQEEMWIAITENDEQQPAKDMPAFDIYEEAINQLNIYLATIAEADETASKEERKWLLAAALGFGGGNSGMSENQATTTIMNQDFGLSGSGNKYANDLSKSIQSFEYMRRDDFTNINHLPPLSFGLTARKSIGKNSGLETGLIYTNLASRFEWSNWGTYDAHQTLHYLGIPVNLAIYLWNTNPNWRIYLSGGFMVEKGLRAVYRQERQMWSEQRLTTVKSSIDGLQWSLNSALGASFRLDKGFGIYFEPRVGYSFDNNQPVSIRTEYPFYFGINIGLNYEL